MDQLTGMIGEEVDRKFVFLPHPKRIVTPKMDQLTGMIGEEVEETESVGEPPFPSSSVVIKTEKRKNLFCRPQV